MGVLSLRVSWDLKRRQGGRRLGGEAAEGEGGEARGGGFCACEPEDLGKITCKT